MTIATTHSEVWARAPAAKLGTEVAREYRRRDFPAQLVLWTGVAILVTTQVYFYRTDQGDRSRTWIQLLVYMLPLWWIWIPVTPWIERLVNYFPIDRRSSLHIGLIHGPASLALGLAHAALDAAWMRVVPPSDRLAQIPFGDLFVAVLRSPDLHLSLLLYWAVATAHHSRMSAQKLTQRQMRAASLEARLHQARTRALEMQLRPHFLFNALNGVSTLLISSDFATASRVLNRLQELLCSTFRNFDRQLVPLHEEIAFVEKYLEIEQIRFVDRLKVVIDIEPEIADSSVPSLLLQPIVENAVRHGIAPKVCGGTLEIRAWQRESRLRIEVQDDGVGIGAGATSSCSSRLGGLGLMSTRERLEHLYGEEADFRLLENSQGTRAVFDLPLGPDCPRSDSVSTSQSGVNDLPENADDLFDPRSASEEPWGGKLLLWSLPGLLLSLQGLDRPEATSHISAVRDFLAWFFFCLPVWWFWMAAAPLVRRLTDQFPPRIDRPWWVAAHVPAALILALGHMKVLSLWTWWMSPVTIPGTAGDLFARLLAGPWISLSLLSYLGIACVARAAACQHLQDAERIEQTRLEAAIARAEIQALHLRCRPEFLLATLGDIESLARRRSGSEASVLLTKMADFLRLVLDAAEQDPPTLRREFAVVRSYAAIETLRQAQSRIQVVVPAEIPDVPVPSLLPWLDEALAAGLEDLQWTVVGFNRGQPALELSGSLPTRARQSVARQLKRRLQLWLDKPPVITLDGQTRLKVNYLLPKAADGVTA